MGGESTGISLPRGITVEARKSDREKRGVKAMKKRILSTILAVCMVLTMLPLTGVTVFADTEDDFSYTVFF